MLLSREWGILKKLADAIYLFLFDGILYEKYCEPLSSFKNVDGKQRLLMIFRKHKHQAVKFNYNLESELRTLFG